MPIQLPQEEGGFAISLGNADFLFEEGGMKVRCSDLVEQLFKKNFPEERRRSSDSDDRESKEAQAESEFRKEIKRLKRELIEVRDERDTAAELFFGATKVKYENYGPTKRNKLLLAMREALENVDVAISNDTINKYLEMGYQKNSRKPQEK